MREPPETNQSISVSGTRPLKSRLPSPVRIVEVGPRDGLQNEPTYLSIQTKVELVEALADCGLRSIECGSFVSPKRIPQMADTAAVFAQIQRRTGVVYSALVPNLRGLAAALEAGAGEAAVFVSASEAFSKANLNCSIEESLCHSQEVIERAVAAKLRVRGYVSCVLGCPFSGEVPAGQVADVATRLYEMGCYEISLGDTIGVGTPRQAQALLEVVARAVPLAAIAVHYHDTYGQALANIFASLEVGVSVVDSSVAGLGGCPFAPGAGGNVATEDVVYLLNGLGIECGVDLGKVASVGRRISTALGRATGSKAGRALDARCRA